MNRIDTERFLKDHLLGLSRTFGEDGKMQDVLVTKLRGRLGLVLAFLLSMLLGVPRPASADGICSQVLQCALTVARSQLMTGLDVCDACNGNGSQIASSVQAFIDNPSITSGCGAANQLLWVAQSIKNADFSAGLQTLACAATGGTFGSLQTCDSSCQNTCARNNLPFGVIPSSDQTRAYNACSARCGCGIVPQIVCGGVGEAFAAQTICHAVGIQDSAPPMTMAMVNTLNLPSIVALTNAVLLKQQVLFISNRATCGYLFPGGRVGNPPPSLHRVAPHLPILWQLEDAGSGSFYVRAQMTGYLLTVSNGRLASVFPADAASAWRFVPVVGQSAAQTPLSMAFTISNVANPAVTLATGAADAYGVAQLQTTAAPSPADPRLAEWVVQPFSGQETSLDSPPPPCPQ